MNISKALVLASLLLFAGSPAPCLAATAQQAKRAMKNEAKADRYLQGGKFEKAARFLEKALKSEPSAKRFRTLVKAYSKAGRFDKAVEAQKRLLKLEPGKAQDRLQLSELLFQAGKPGQGVRSIEKAFEEDPRDKILLLGLKRAYKKAGRAPEAALGERLVPFFTMMAEAARFEKKGKYERAALAYERASRMNPYSADARLRRGDALIELNRLSQALGAYRQAARAAPKDPRAHLKTGRLFIKMKEYEAAAASIKKALALAPEDADAKAAMAEVKPFLPPETP